MWTRRLGTKVGERGRDTGGGFKDPNLSGRRGVRGSGQVKSSQVKLCTRVDWPSGLLGGQPTSERSLVGGVDSALQQTALTAHTGKAAGRCTQVHVIRKGALAEAAAVKAPESRARAQLV